MRANRAVSSIRYIAINDGVDTDKGVDESLAIRDLFNEWHARDTSKKIKAVKMAAAKRGERIGSKPPYGYQKDPNDPKRIVPNEDPLLFDASSLYVPVA
ncbi:hypothetical protein [Lacrimispora sp. JR3]|uniref:hypothetical protein n=1 Tax=Lacrimispora sinapis TaxID=3111456 RepID=UPI00374964CE